MTVNETLISGRPLRGVMRPVIVSILVMSALLLGLFAVHSAGAGAAADHELSVGAPAASADAEYGTGMNGTMVGTAVVVAVASGFDGGWLSFGDGLMAGCGILAMACSVLLIVVALIRFARQPSVYARLLDAGGLAVRSIRMIPLQVHRPSLTLLSISRI